MIFEEVSAPQTGVGPTPIQHPARGASPRVSKRCRSLATNKMAKRGSRAYSRRMSVDPVTVKLSLRSSGATKTLCRFRSVSRQYEDSEEKYSAQVSVRVAISSWPIMALRSRRIAGHGARAVLIHADGERRRLLRAGRAPADTSALSPAACQSAADPRRPGLRSGSIGGAHGHAVVAARRSTGGHAHRFAMDTATGRRAAIC